MTNDVTLATLYARLRKLEKQDRYWRIAALAMCCVIVLATLLGAGQSKPKTLACGELRLEDDSGKLRGLFTIRPNNTPGIALFDADGRLRLSLDMSTEGEPGVNLHDEVGTVRAALAVRPDHTPGLALFDSSGAIRASVDVGTDHSAGVHVYDPNGVLRGALALRPDDVPALGLFNDKAEVTQSIEGAGDARGTAPRAKDGGQ